MLSLPQAAAAAWRLREEVEIEAAGQFNCLAKLFEETGAPQTFVALAKGAEADEYEHAERCTSLVTSLQKRHAKPIPRTAKLGGLGPSGLSNQQAALYTAVALGCITESLSTALLGAICEHAEVPEVAETAHYILKDEIRHSRLGWGYLEHCQGADLRWLAPWIPRMLNAALAEEAPKGPFDGIAEGALAPYGVLSQTQAQAICQQTIDGVVVPGLQHFGVPV